MVYSRDWSKNNPVDHSKFNSIAGQARNIRIDLEERLRNLFYGLISGETQATEGVKNLPFYVQASDPGATADKIKLYGKDVNSIVELFVEDENGLVKQLVGLRAGDMLMSSNTTTPNGFTDVSATYADKFIRISSGTPLTIGGNDSHTHGAGSYTNPSHNHGGTTGGPIGDRIVGDAGNPLGVNTNGHTHNMVTQASATITGTSASANNIPAYIQLKMYQKD